MAEESKETFLSRWSRRKRESKEAAEAQPSDQQTPPAETPPELPRLEDLGFDSDYTGFLHPKVDEDTKRAALKRLFSDPRFNVMDGLDVYIDDYAKPNVLPAEMLAGLRQAQRILDFAREMREQEIQAQQPATVSGPTAAALEAPRGVDASPTDVASLPGQILPATEPERNSN